MRPKQLANFLEIALKEKLCVLIKGAPGTGKTEIIEQSCRKLNHDMILEHPVVSDPTDYKGLPFVDKKGESAHFLPFGNLNRLIHTKKPTVFFMDDLGQAPPAVQAACMQLMLARRINGHRLSDNVVILAATNRQKDRAGVTGMLEPVKSRFATIIELEPNVDDWVEWAYRNDVPNELIAFISFRKNLLHDFKPTSDLTNSPSPRTVFNVARLINAGISEESYYEIISGAAGEGFATEFITFVKMAKELPTVEYMLANPEKFDIPADPGTKYAMAVALARSATIKNKTAIFKIAERLPKEFEVLLIRDAILLEKKLQKTIEYTKWVSKNSSIII